MQNEVLSFYGNRLRMRICGLLYCDERLLMVNHQLHDRPSWWAPPGGGLEFGEPLRETLVREFAEETHVKISVGDFAFGCEYLHEPLHAVELFFWVHQIGGSPATGQDPELPIIKDVRYMNPSEIQSLLPDHAHGILKIARTRSDIEQLKGFYRI